MSFRLAGEPAGLGFSELGLCSAPKNRRQKWVFANLREAGKLLWKPVTRAVRHRGWKRALITGEAWLLVLDRIRHLSGLGLHCHMVALNFVHHHLAPLQAWQEPAWRYSGPSDPRRLRRDKLDNSAVAVILEELLNPEGVIAFPKSMRPLYDDEWRETILASLPACDRWGIICVGSLEVDRPNPFLWPEGAFDSGFGDAEGDKGGTRSVDEDEGSSSAPSGLGAVSPDCSKRGPAARGESSSRGAGQHCRQTVIIGMNEWVLLLPSCFLQFISPVACS